MSWLKTTVLIGLLATPIALSAQGPPREDPFGKHLFPAELVMAHQQAIGLQEAPRNRILQELRAAQNVFMDLQMQMGAQSEKLNQLLQVATVDEAAVLAQVDRVLELEREMKKRHIALLVRIRNLLSAQQRAKLAELRGEF
jgi:Spy/CpxP family protein refolding chaperone